MEGILVLLFNFLQSCYAGQLEIGGCLSPDKDHQPPGLAAERVWWPGDDAGEDGLGDGGCSVRIGGGVDAALDAGLDTIWSGLGDSSSSHSSTGSGEGSLK